MLESTPVKDWHRLFANSEVSNMLEGVGLLKDAVLITHFKVKFFLEGLRLWAYYRFSSHLLSLET
jgi:hypothetical protein